MQDLYHERHTTEYCLGFRLCKAWRLFALGLFGVVVGALQYVLHIPVTIQPPQLLELRMDVWLLFGGLGFSVYGV